MPGATAGDARERRRRGEPADSSSVVLASNLLYLTPAQRAELTEKLFALLRDYELEAPGHVPEGAQRMATMWSMIPDDRGNAPAAAPSAVHSAAPTGRAGNDSGTA